MGIEGACCTTMMLAEDHDHANTVRDSNPPSRWLKHTPIQTTTEVLTALAQFRELPEGRSDLHLPDDDDVKTTLGIIHEELDRVKARVAESPDILQALANDPNALSKLTDDHYCILMVNSLETPYPWYRLVTAWMIGDRRDAAVAKHVGPYARLYIDALMHCPIVSRTASRAMKVQEIPSLVGMFENPTAHCRAGAPINFWGLSSFTVNDAILKDKAFAGDARARTIIYKCDALPCVDIRPFSLFPKDEREVMPVPPAMFVAMGISFTHPLTPNHLFIPMKYNGDDKFAYITPPVGAPPTAARENVAVPIPTLQPAAPPLHTRISKRFIRYLTPCPQSHNECWEGNAPTTLTEKATVQMLFLPSRPTHEGFSTPHVALMCGSSAAAKLVLDAVLAATSATGKAAGGITTSNGLTLLHAAALGGQPAAVLQQLVLCGCSPTAKDADGCSVMHFAATGGSVDTLEFILTKGGRMTDKDSDGYTVMMAAAEGGSIEAMKFVLANGGRMADKRGDDYTVVMAAAYGGSVDAIKFVLANGGNMTDKRSDGFTVMMAAAQGGFVEAMKFVLDNGGNVTDRDSGGYTVMMAAAFGGSIEAMNFVLDNGGSLTEKTRSGHTVMMHAAQGGSVEAMKLILANGGCMTDRASDGFTVMMFAASGGSVEAMRLVQANGGRLMGVLRHCSSNETKEFCRLNGGD